MAFDATHVDFHGPFHGIPGILGLFMNIHGLERMAVLAGLGAVGLILGPDRLRQFQTLGLEFSGGIHIAGYLVIELVNGADLPVHPAEPGFRNVAVGAHDLNARPVGVMGGLFVFGIDIVFHLMTRDAVFQAFAFIQKYESRSEEGHTGEAAGDECESPHPL